MLLGDNVKVDFNWAEFQEIAPAPASLQAAKALGTFGPMPGYVAKPGDAIGAYCQTYLTGVRTWVHLPKDRWPTHWIGKYTDPVVPLVLALYGHPEAGGLWQARCLAKIKPLGWKQIEGWNSVFWHEKKKALLVLYVDDFKLAAKKDDHDQLWKEIRAVSDMDEESEDGRFLGVEAALGSNVALNWGFTNQELGPLFFSWMLGSSQTCKNNCV